MAYLKSVEDCDKELREYRKALRLCSVEGRIAVWEQIDAVLDVRIRLARRKVRLQQS